ncbi:MAG: class I tRNA ligase family protein [Candidatus Staskawiczbacteria bacterium]|nr:class I tRNA ligase family protein [Candidatus Staskawiczbacteria bacterium]
MELPSAYNSKEVEDKIYQLWEKSGFFNPDKLPNAKKRKPFTIIMPPTNANGNLHAGHALVMTIEDIMTRYKRMRGFKALWLPGLDHAGFETQVVYEKQLEKEGRSRFKMTPEDLYKEIWDFTQKNKSNIISQVRKMGASCDWSREKFTLDDNIVKTVYSTFEKLKKDGLVYKGKKIINWCPKHQTSLSDLETKDDERSDKFYYLKYGPFTIATARPETKFGDKYVVMHPKDKRYADYKDGQKIELEWINGPITATIIKDEAIDMDFGTGVMTITPWHDAVDFEIAERHNLDKEQIIDFYGRLLPIAGEFAGMKILEARPKIIEKLQTKGLVEKIEENYKHIVKTCYKCNSLIEPQIKEQWFLKMKPLAKPAIKAIKNGEIKFIPEHYKKIALHWLNNIIDWNISRQIAWGIPIPGDQEHQVFDTWFSSGQWPYATLGFPKSKDFKTFYPTDVMETGGDLIFFWVSRMIMFSLYNTKKIPFKNVYIHGLVLDAKGQKMSKSKGNVINPLDLTEKYGTDALRMALVVGNTPGTSLPLDENKIKGYRNFATKIWNASRFVLMNLQDYKADAKIQLNAKDKKVLSDFKKQAKGITKDMDGFKFYSASEKIYHYFWHTFCDKIIEEQKPRLYGSDLKEKAGSQRLLITLLGDSLKIMHPFMPFITEEIYQQLPIKNKQKCLMVEEWIIQ